MERLTKKEMLAGHEVHFVSGDDCFDVWSAPKKFMGEAIDRLAAYEDTGMEPEEVAEYKRLCDSYVQAGLDAKFVQFCIDATQSGLTIGRLRELARAEKDGRLVVLPSKPDATAYQWKNGDDVPSLFRFDGVTISEDGEIAYQTHWGETFKPDDFGKTVFLTREEAEAALKKMEEADDEKNDSD